MAPAPASSPSSSALPVFPEPLPPSSELLVPLHRALSSASRIVVLTGAGISTASGIPDFRSASSGLFASLREEAAMEGVKLASGKDLFSMGVYKDPDLLSLHHKLLARLHDLAEGCEPSAFHKLLARWNDEGRLLRCLTQNIDRLEEKAGLSFGVPPPPAPRRKPSTSASSASPSSTPTPSPSAAAVLPPTPPPTPPTRPAPAPIPRTIPLHGALGPTLSCPLCAFSTPLPHPPLSSGAPSLPCPNCSDFAVARSAAGVRPRTVGQLRAGVVLYGEEHPHAEQVGAAVAADLRARPDFLVVAGTSLKIPGSKRVVREFAKAVRARGGAGVRTVLLNREFPTPKKEWEGVFDVWVEGDLQEFVGRHEQWRAAPPPPAAKRKAAVPPEAAKANPAKKARTAPASPASRRKAPAPAAKAKASPKSKAKASPAKVGAAPKAKAPAAKAKVNAPPKAQPKQKTEAVGIKAAFGVVGKARAGEGGGKKG